MNAVDTSKIEGSPTGLSAFATRADSVAQSDWFHCEISRQRLKALVRRNNGNGLGHFIFWFACLAVSGYAAFISWGTWWAIPAFFLYGTIYCSADAAWHECSHGTAFRSSILNEMFYYISSFMTFKEPTFWRWSHARHHTYTIFSEYDQEIQAPRPVTPATIMRLILDFFFLNTAWAELKNILLHAVGRFRSDQKFNFIPEGEKWKVVLGARIYIVLIIGLIAWCIAVKTILPAMFIILPRVYGNLLMHLFSVQLHAGLAENVFDHRLNTRTVLMNPVYRFLVFNMNYHVEHHMFPMVPYHALPRLHEALRDQMPKPYNGLVQAFKEIIPTLARQLKEKDYFVVRELPSPGDHRGKAVG